MSFSVRQLTADDASSLDAFLRPHTTKAFYLRSNALKAGVIYESKPLQGEYFGAFKDKQLLGVLSYSWLNTILLFATEDACLPTLADHARPAILARGGKIEAILGLKHQADLVTQSLALTTDDFRKDDEDWLFELDVPGMVSPKLLADPSFHVRRADSRDFEQLAAWRVDFAVESLGNTRSPELETKIREEVEMRLKEKSWFVLEKEGQLISFGGMTGTRETIPTTMFIGPIWTPPDLRGRGYAKTVTAGMIAHIAQEWGTLEKAALFASRPDAIRVYESLGFKKIADWRLAFPKESYTLAPESPT